jgi:SHS2 domain-containing protein
MLIDHTADLGIRVFGKDERQLYNHAGLALFDLIVHPGPPKKGKIRRISVQGMDWPDLMAAWLRELLYLWSGKEILVQNIDIKVIKPFMIEANLECLHFDPIHHEIRHDIKAVTYHGLDVKQEKKGWTSTIIFDV